MTGPFDRIQWSTDDAGFEIDGVAYRVEQLLGDDGAGETEPSFFRFYKPRAMVDQYRSLFAGRPDWRPATIFELGIWHGGSAAFWSQIWEPDRLVAVDYLDRGDPELLSHFRARAAVGAAISTHWGVDQADRDRLRGLAAQELPAGIDFVVDDASHKYRQTRASFETLFPLMNSGGLYVIEDWSWSLDPSFLQREPEWRSNDPLAPIVQDLAELVATRPDAVGRLEVFPDFIAVERGTRPLEDLSFESSERDRTRASIERRTRRQLRRLIRR